MALVQEKELQLGLNWVDGVLGVSPGCWDPLLNPLEMLWAYQCNTEEGGQPLDNPERHHHSCDESNLQVSCLQVSCLQLGI